MKTKIINIQRSLFIVLSILLLSYSCAPTQTRITATSESKHLDWEKIDMNEDDFQNYFLNKKLAPLEGIWSHSEKTGWVNVISGIKEDRNNNNIYEIAIIKNINGSYNGYIIKGWGEWKTGYLKCTFHPTSHENIFQVDWYMGNFSIQKWSAVLDQNGMIQYEGERDYWTAYPINYYRKSTSMKIFPSHKEKKINTGTGSGFLISNNGYVVTNYHVVEDADSLVINFPILEIKKTGDVVMKDKNNDIAILKLKDFNYSELSLNSIPFTIGDIGNVNLGQEVYTLGFPLGDIMGITPRYSEGSVSSLYGLDDSPSHFQISNPLQPGNSGGPLFNSNGELIGIVVSGLNAKLFSDYLGIVPQNVNFAIKINYLKSLIEMLPNSQDLLDNKNNILNLSKEEQIKEIQNYIVQVRKY